MYNICIMSVSKTMLNIKVDTNLKKKAQKLSKDFGLSLSTVINRKLQEFVENEEIFFQKSTSLNKKTANFLEQADKEIDAGNMKNFSNPFSPDEFLVELKK